MSLSSSLFAVDGEIAYVPEKLLAMSDQALFEAGLGYGVGLCVVEDWTNQALSVVPDNQDDAALLARKNCDFTVRTKKSFSSSSDLKGLPHGTGFGCVVAPNHLPRKFSGCPSSEHERYDKYSNDPNTSICTDDHVKNAANMIRIGIRNGLCAPDPNIVAE